MNSPNMLTINAKDGPIYVGVITGHIGLAVNIDKAYVHTFLTPGEVDNLIAALTDAKGRVK